MMMTMMAVLLLLMMMLNMSPVRITPVSVRIGEPRTLPEPFV